MNEAVANDEICRVGRSLFERGYAHATAGNISVKLDDGFLITPTDACIGFPDPARISKVGLEGEHLSGDAPSKTLRLHEHIYATCAELKQPTRCVIHTHSTHCVALVAAGANMHEFGRSQNADGFAGCGRQFRSI